MTWNYRMIARTLHRAADQYLRARARELGEGDIGKQTYSCCAVSMAAEAGDVSHCIDWLRELGVDTGGRWEFSEFAFGIGCRERTQGARYLWLKWAALMAEARAI